MNLNFNERKRTGPTTRWRQQKKKHPGPTTSRNNLNQKHVDPNKPKKRRILTKQKKANKCIDEKKIARKAIGQMATSSGAFAKYTLRS